METTSVIEANHQDDHSNHHQQDRDDSNDNGRPFLPSLPVGFDGGCDKGGVSAQRLSISSLEKQAAEFFSAMILIFYLNFKD